MGLAKVPGGRCNIGVATRMTFGEVALLVLLSGHLCSTGEL